MRSKCDEYEQWTGKRWTYIYLNNGLVIDRKDIDKCNLYNHNKYFKHYDFINFYFIQIYWFIYL